MEKRFYINYADIQNNLINITGDEHEHLSKVLRLRVGDTVECFYDNSDILNCDISQITKMSSTLKINASIKSKANPSINVTLFQGLPKQDKLELITQKITELGLSAIVPFSSTFCIAKQNDNKLDRLKKIIISACKQCGRTQLTEVKSHVSFNEMITSLEKYDIVIFANETENSLNLKQLFNNINIEHIKKVAIIVGSEGGFSKEEIESLTNLNNTYSISLGKRILRTETASIALSSLIMFLLNQM